MVLLFCIMLHILWETLTAINTVPLIRKRCDSSKIGLSCHTWTICVCFYSRWTQMSQCSQWLSIYSLTEPPLSPLIQPESLLVCAPLRCIPQSSEVKSLLFCRLDRRNLFTHITTQHTQFKDFKTQSIPWSNTLPLKVQFSRTSPCCLLAPFIYKVTIF